MSKLNALMSNFGVVSAVDGDTMSATQHLTRDLADHRGRLEMPAYAMMAESITSGTFWHTFDEAVATVQSWLSLTAGAPIGLDQRLFATTELLHSDGQQGAVTLRIANERDEVVCGGLARCVLVGRTGEHLGTLKSGIPTKTADLIAHVTPRLDRSAADRSGPGRSADSRGDWRWRAICRAFVRTALCHGHIE